MTTRLEQIKADWEAASGDDLDITWTDLAALLLLAEAAERWEEADVKLYTAEKSVPPGIGKLSENISHNYRTALDEWGRTKESLLAAVRAFREGGGKG